MLLYICLNFKQVINLWALTYIKEQVLGGKKIEKNWQ